ncbi:hypothetical protein C8Q80DRAFT_1269734 [Daedaleopsis nitida]|nr:hypothetical protein C8Q80DRAFT_1269734 [Daedaleopsis nitida]
MSDNDDKIQQINAAIQASITSLDRYHYSPPPRFWEPISSFSDFSLVGSGRLPVFTPTPSPHLPQSYDSSSNVVLTQSETSSSSAEGTSSSSLATMASSVPSTSNVSPPIKIEDPDVIDLTLDSDSDEYAACIPSSAKGKGHAHPLVPIIKVDIDLTDDS